MLKKLITLSPASRLALWILLVLLTAGILLFPVHLSPEYHPIQSLYIFDSLPLFSALFYVWLLMLFWLLFSGKSDHGHWEKMALVCIASLVFLAFWAVILPYGRLDYMANASLVRLIQQNGQIPSGSTLYADFPGMHLITTSLSQVTGLEIFETATVLLVFNALVFAALLYVLFSKVLANTTMAAFAAIVVMLGNQLLARAYTFWPGVISLALLLAFLVVLTRGSQNPLETLPDRLLAIVLLIAVTVMYFQTSVLFALILLGLYLVQKLGKVKPVAIPIIVLFIVIPLVWEIYGTVQTFPMLVDFASKIIDDITAGTFLDWIPFLAAANVGESFPLWSSLVRYFWWVLIFGVGTILGLVKLLQVRKLGPSKRVLVGGLLGAIALATVATLVAPGGERFVHFLQYAAFFTVPVLLGYFLIRDNWLKAYGFAALVVVVFALSFPTFLISNNKIGTDAYYSYEDSTGEFLHRWYGNGEGLILVNPFEPLLYYLPEASFEMGFWGTGDARTEDEFWQKVNDIVERYSKGDQELYMIHGGLKEVGESHFGISRIDPRWDVIDERIQDTVQEYYGIYDNGYVQIYTNEGRD
jgi:hypothetical protein